MIKATDGWILKLIKTNHRCWLVRLCSIIVVSFICLSCGKKIVDNNKENVQTNKTNIRPQETQLKISLNSSGGTLSASHYIRDRVFLDIPSYIESTRPIRTLSIFFNVVEDAYEYVCDYIRDGDKLIFSECIDDQSYIIKHLIPGERVHLPANREIYFESLTNGIDSSELTLNIINK